MNQGFVIRRIRKIRHIVFNAFYRFEQIGPKFTVAKFAFFAVFWPC